MTSQKNLSRIFLIVLLVSVLFACYLVYRSFIAEFLLAAIIVTVFYPFYLRLNKLLRGKKMISSFLMCLLIMLFIVIPFTNLVFFGAQRSVEAYNDLSSFFNGESLNNAVERISENTIVKKLLFFVDADVGIKNYLLEKTRVLRDWVFSGAINDWALALGKNVLTFTANTIASILIVFFSMFFFFMDGEQMVKKLMYWTPLPNKYDHAIFDKFKDVSYSTIFSTLVTAIAQGAIGAIGFLIVGLPAFFLSIAMAFASIVPYVGTALVWVPSVLYLLATGSIWQAIFMVIWGSIVVSNSDNLIRTYLIKDKVEVHPLFVFFSIIGGIALFGFWGIVFGPLVISLAVTILHIYEMEYIESLEK